MILNKTLLGLSQKTLLLMKTLLLGISNRLEIINYSPKKMQLLSIMPLFYSITLDGQALKLS
jgi:hypothetical protein